MDEAELKRMIWRARRGLLELDLQLAPFAQNVLPTMSPADQVLFRDMLLLPDNDLMDYLNEKSVCPDPRIAPMIERVRKAQHSYFE